jgi:isocitrate/isopropylmalate dehydrogenase
LATITPQLEFSFSEARIGMGAFEATGDPLPEETIQAAREADAVLHGATDGASLPPGLPKPLRRLRMALETYATIRPAVSYPGVQALRSEMDVIVVREISEGLNSEAEYRVGTDAVCSVRITTRQGTERVAAKAFEVAKRRRKLVTAVHKRGALPQGDGLWIEAIEAVAASYPDVTLDLRNVDSAAHELIHDPSKFDVILAENSRGDILSDIAASLVGGLGLTASGVFGDQWAYFEPIHGTAPDIAGKGIANPCATILAAKLMLDHLGELAPARLLHAAVERTLRNGNVLTRDLGGIASTDECADAVIENLQ